MVQIEKLAGSATVFSADEGTLTAVAAQTARFTDAGT